jgi:hypothetical protein
MSVDLIGLILVPISIFLIGAVIASIRGAIRFAQYMVRSEEAQTRTADSTREISERLGAFISETEDRLNEHGERLAVVEWEIGTNGRRATGRPAIKPH